MDLIHKRNCQLHSQQCLPHCILNHLRRRRRRRNTDPQDITVSALVTCFSFLFSLLSSFSFLAHLLIKAHHCSISTWLCSVLAWGCDRCNELLWLVTCNCPWKHSRSTMTELWASWCNCRCSCSLRGSCTRWPLKVSPYSDDSDSLRQQNLFLLPLTPKHDMQFQVLTLVPISSAARFK